VISRLKGVKEMNGNASQMPPFELAGENHFRPRRTSRFLNSRQSALSASFVDGLSSVTQRLIGCDWNAAEWYNESWIIRKNFGGAHRKK
jgi:hypothetical protein